MWIWHIYAKNRRCCNRREEDILPWPGQFLVCYRHFSSSLVFSITHHVTLNAIFSNSKCSFPRNWLLYNCVCARVCTVHRESKSWHQVSLSFSALVLRWVRPVSSRNTCLSVPCASLQTLLPLDGIFSIRGWPLTSKSQPRATAMVYIVWRVTYTWYLGFC